MRDVRRLIPNIPHEPTPSATLYEKLWFKLDGAYEAHRKARRLYERHKITANDPLTLWFDEKTVALTKQRVQGIVECIEIMSEGVLTEEEVKKMCLARFKERQPKTSRSE